MRRPDQPWDGAAMHHRLPSLTRLNDSMIHTVKRRRKGRKVEEPPTAKEESKDSVMAQAVIPQAVTGQNIKFPTASSLQFIFLKFVGFSRLLVYTHCREFGKYRQLLKRKQSSGSTAERFSSQPLVDLSLSPSSTAQCSHLENAGSKIPDMT